MAYTEEFRDALQRGNLDSSQYVDGSYRASRDARYKDPAGRASPDERQRRAAKAVNSIYGSEKVPQRSSNDEGMDRWWDFGLAGDKGRADAGRFQEGADVPYWRVARMMRNALWMFCAFMFGIAAFRICDARITTLSHLPQFAIDAR